MIWWVRHGESTWNAAGLHQGSNRLPPLTPRGHRQSEEAAQVLAVRGIDALCSSPARRALQTAAVIGRRCGVAATVEPALIECDLDETEDAVAHRLRAFVQDHGSTDRVVVAVSHGDTIRAAARLLGAPPIEVPPNGAILRLYAGVADTVHARPLTGAGAVHSQGAPWTTRWTTR